MNAEKFSDAMSELDTKYVDEALNYKKKAKRYVIIALNQHTPRYGNPSLRRQVWRKVDPARSGG